MANPGSARQQLIPEENITKELSFDEARKQLANFNKEVIQGGRSLTEYFNECYDGDSVLKKYVTTTDQQTQSVQGLIKASQEARAKQLAQNEAVKASTLSAQAGQAAIQALASAGNTLIMWGISQAINGLYELSQVSNNVAQRASEVGNSFAGTKAEIEGYKTQIDQLYSTINSSSSSIQEVTNARRELLSVQDEMIARFGEEKDTIALVTEAISGQTGALDTLTQKEWQAAKNEFNDGDFFNNISNFFNGYSDNMDRMIDEYGNYSSRIQLNPLLINDPESYEQIKEMLESFGAVFGQTEEGLLFADLSGTASDVYDKLLDIQTLAGQLEVNDSFTNQFTQLANSAKDVVDKYSGYWDQHVINDLILKDETATAYFKQITDAHQAYEDAYVSGDKERIGQALENFSAAMPGDNEIEDPYISEYFQNMYPEMQSIIDDWHLEADIAPTIKPENFSTLQDKTESEVLALLQDVEKTPGTLMQKASNVTSGKAEFEELAKLAEQYGISVDGSAENTQKLIDLLVEAGIIQRDLSAQPPIVERPKWDYSTTLQNLDSMKETMSVLDNVYTKLMESGGQISFDSLSSLNAAFSDLDNAEDYIKRIQEASENMDTEAATSAIEDLMGAYIVHSDILSNVTEENQGLITSMLEEMGILNAEELVLSALDKTMESVALEKQFLAENGYELANASLEEMNQFLNEANASEEARAALARYALSKMDINNHQISTSADIDNVIALANAAQASSEVLDQLTRAKNVLAVAEKTNTPSALGDDYKEAMDLIKQIESGTYDYGFTPIDPNAFKVNYAPKQMSQGAKSANSYADAQKNLAKSTDSASDAVNRQNEALQKQKEALEDSKKELEDVYNAVQWFYDKQIDSIDKSIDKLEEANKALEKQKEHYDSILSVVDDVYDEEIGRIKDRMDAMDKSNETAEKELALEKAKQALEDARNRKTLRTYSKGRGFVYTADEAAVRQAEDDLATATEEQVKSRLQDQIDLLEEWKNKWAEIPKAYEKAMDEMAAMEMFGPNYKDFILNSTDSDINRFKNDYTGFQSGMDANDARIDAYQKQKEKLEELKSLWEDSKNAYRDSQYQSHLSSYFGSNYEYQLLHNSASWRAQYASQYADVCRQLEEVEKKLKNNRLSGSSRSGNAYAKGHRGISHSEKALVGESGPEILVRNGVFQTIDNPQLMDLKKGDIIFNHEQTRAILSGSSSFNASGRQAFQHFKETALAKHSTPYSRALSQPLLTLPVQNRTENTVLHFHGDLSFPNITSGNDARRLVSELENLSLKAGQRAGKR